MYSKSNFTDQSMSEMPTVMITITMRTATMMAEIVVVVAKNTVANVSVKIQVILTLIQVKVDVWYILTVLHIHL